MNICARTLLAGLACAALAACENESKATLPSVAELEQSHATWESRHFTRYAYHYMTSGYFNAFDGRSMRLVVLGDTVRSAQFVATNDTVPGATTLPTIDRLFELAIQARKNGTLLAADLDSTFVYPTRLVFDGLPDASGSILASNIEFLP